MVTSVRFVGLSPNQEKLDEMSQYRIRVLALLVLHAHGGLVRIVRGRRPQSVVAPSAVLTIGRLVLIFRSRPLQLEVL